LHADINTYLKSWKFPYDSVSHGKKITLAQLLSHSAGLTVHGFPGYDRKDTIPSLPQVLNGKRPANTPAVRSQFEPGLRFQYSGGGTTISQLIIQDVTKQPYDKFMYDNVLKPTGMSNSFYNQPPLPAKIPLCATGYFQDGTAVPNKFHVYPEQGAAGLWMTPTDLCNYIIETQMALEGRSSRVLNQEMTKLRLTPYNDKSSALGVFIENRDSALYFQHSAGNAGFCGIYYGSMEGGNGVAVFLNTENFALLPEIVNSVASVYNWTNFYKPVVKKVITVPEGILKTYTGIYHFEDQLVHIYKKEDGYYMYTSGTDSKMYFTSDSHFFNMEFASEKDFVTNDLGKVTGYLRTVNGKTHPAASKVNHADTIHASKDQFNAIGWHLLETQQPALAIEFLQRGVDLYPGDLVLTGNLAHAHLFNNEYQKALNIYKAHRTEKLTANFSWEDMINEDFLFFKKAGIDKAPMDRIYNDLQMKKPFGF
jgi:CubicO group peptidase (beta-lactamase class C family)